MTRQILTQSSEHRLNYGEQLMPNPGFYLDFAIGLTYSLNLDALLSIPIAMGKFGDMEGHHKKNKIYILDAVSKCADKMVVFCNASSIMNASQRYKELHTLFDTCVFPVNLKSKGNFHPKLWVLRYVNYVNGKKAQKYYKVIVLSRNITFDRDFDVAATLTGNVVDYDSYDSNKGHKNRNKPLADLLRFVVKYLPSSQTTKKNEIKSLADDIEHYLNFKIDNDDFVSYDFLPFIPKADAGNTWAEYTETAEKIFEHPKKMILVSPFLSTEVVAKMATREDGTFLNDTNDCVMLITRRESLNEKIEKYFKDNIYVVNDRALDDSALEHISDERDIYSEDNVLTSINEENTVNGKNDVDDDVTWNVSHDVHAKIIYEKKYERGKYKRFLCLGSLNATHSAFHNNVELMLRLNYKDALKDTSKDVYYETLRKDLIGDKDNISPFERFIGEAPKLNEVPEEVDFRDLGQVIRGARVEQSTKDTCKVIITYANLETDAEIALFSDSNGSDFSKLVKGEGEKKVRFDNIPLSHISNFYLIRRKSKSENYVYRVFVVSTEGLEELLSMRNAAIYRSVFNSPEKLFEYVLSSLSGDLESFEPSTTGGTNADFGKRKRVTTRDLNKIGAGIYEQMLRTAANNPQSVEAVKELLDKLGADLFGDKITSAEKAEIAKLHDLIDQCQEVQKLVKI
jgi:hypothetical protein